MTASVTAFVTVAGVRSREERDEQPIGVIQLRLRNDRAGIRTQDLPIKGTRRPEDDWGPSASKQDRKRPSSLLRIPIVSVGSNGLSTIPLQWADAPSSFSIGPVAVGGRACLVADAALPSVTYGRSRARFLQACRYFDHQNGGRGKTGWPLRIATAKQPLMSKLAGYLLAACIVSAVVSCDHSPTDSPAANEWPVASAESQGLDPDILDTLTIQLREGRFGRISSLLIVRHGYLVYEEYFRGHDRERLHPVYSVTKSVTSALIGIALEQGKIASIDLKLLDLFPEYQSLANMTVAKGQITLRHVLQMKAGFAWDEWSTPYGSPNNPTTQLVQSSDWIKFVLDLPMAGIPGVTFTYNSGCTMLLSGVLKNATGMSARSYAERVLFNPLGISAYTWEMGPNNIANTGWGLSLRSRDMAKLGYLYLRNGVWKERQVVSQEWVDQSSQPHIRFANGGGYGFQWWLLALGEGGSDPMAPYAAGWGGQYIFVIPERDMVAVSTAEEYNGQSEIRTVLFDHVFAADREAAGPAAPAVLPDQAMPEHPTLMVRLDTR